MNNKTVPAILTSFFIFGLASDACANAGIPMLALTLPGMVISLIPIIFIEALILRRFIGDISFWHSLKVMGIANLLSTILGMPSAWIVLVMIEMGYGLVLMSLNYQGIPNSFLEKFLAVTIGAAWLGPSENELYWMLPTATLVLLVPFFFASWLFEYSTIKKLLKGHDRTTLWQATKLANIASYCLLGLVVIIWLIASIKTGKIL